MKERPETTTEKATVTWYIDILYLLTIGCHFRSFFYRMKAALSANEPTCVVEYPREMKDSCQIKKGPVMGLGRKTALESSEKFTAKCTDFCNCKKCLR
jgi:hypothetical protein